MTTQLYTKLGATGNIVTATTDPVTGEVTELTASGRDVLSDLNIGEGESAIKSLYPVGYIAHTIFSTDGTYVFGRSTATTSKIVRGLVGTNTVTTGTNSCAGGAINTIAVTSTPGLLFASAGGSGATVGYLERSTDYGDTWTQVLAFGSGGGGSIQTVRMLSDRSFCEVTLSGVRTFFVAEYNVNGSRVNGAANDRLSLWKSVDLGLTWTEVAYWNADGSNNNIKHFHAIKVDPFTNRLYILAGDENVANGIISWDGVTALQNNTNISAMTNSAGVITVFGQQRYRACDLIFDQNYLYYLADAPVGAPNFRDASSQTGWWRCDKSLTRSSFNRIGASILQRIASDATIGGLVGAQTSSGSMVWVDFSPASAVAGDTNISVYHTNVERTKEARVGKLQVTSSAASVPGHVCVAGDYIYFGILGTGLGKSASATSVCKVSEIDFVAPRPDPLHPVWWIDPTDGSDANDGTLPTAAFKTLTYAFQGSRLTQGGRLQYPAVYKADEAAHTATSAVNTTGADATEYVTIAGMGALNTKVFQGGTNAYFYKVAAIPIELQDIWFGSNYLTSGVSLFSANGANINFVMRFIRSITGNNNGLAQISVWPNVGAGYTATVKSYDSVHCGFATGSNGIFDDVNASAGKAYYFERSAVIGGKFNIRMLADASTLSWKDSDFIDCSTSATPITIPTTASALPTGKRGRFALNQNVAQIAYGGAITPSNNFVQCKSNRTLSPAAFFDYQSEVVAYDLLLNDILKNPVNVLEWSFI
jgi:hypothetical protein